MELTKRSILNHKKLIPGIEGYLILVSKIENNVTLNPDISIEACKSLIEGLCLKALSILSDEYNASKKIRASCKNDLNFLTHLTFEEIYSNYVESQIHESLSNMVIDISVAKKIKENAKRKIKEQAQETIGKISAVRNERGDISHGRNYPKKQESTIKLAQSINSITDGICSFMIEEFAIQYKEKYKIADKLIYEDLTEFNNWLDETHNVLSIKIDFSKLLYDSAYEKYEEYYILEYLPLFEKEDETEILEIVDTGEDLNEETIDVELPVKVINKEANKKSPNLTDEEAKELYDKIFNKKDELIIIKTLVNNFDKTSFWTETRIRQANIFCQEHNLKEEEFIELLNSYYEDDRLPARSDIANHIMMTKPPLKSLEAVVEPLSIRIKEFAEELKN